MAFSESDLQVIKDTAFAIADDRFDAKLEQALPGIIKAVQEQGGQMADRPDWQEGEVEEEIGTNKAWAVNLKMLVDEAIKATRRSYDEYQDLALETARRGRTAFDKTISDAQQFDGARQVMANQAMQNAIETANMVSKQAVRHSDLAIDRQWNVDEVASLVANTSTFKDAIAAAVAEGVNAAVARVATVQTTSK